MNYLKHLAIIMDGNGRWAERQNKKRSSGHEEGANNVRTITQYCAKIGVEYLTLYAFSTENWKRPKTEVEFLMKLLTKFLKKELIVLKENNIRFEVIGDISKFSNSLQKAILHLKKETVQCSGMTQILAINYGSRDEITRAVNKAIKTGVTVSEEDISQLLDTSNFPDIDLLIRTGGDQRLSNFLLWQSAYAELFFTSTLWPDFSTGELETILSKYKTTSRRFGAL
ncbi:di-trans,poly-cis-decaprenylcistransferase [Sulfurospirillum arcachonense]|uniref:di-trans,poly-cis-decaprenylcistransferase n=1 Tax=Sulfurospirillum arcachonense TaxID=57666 RepID=UPI00046ABE3C|nr:di-trans,poly-cis-decaprenylcistransferase [Sulfurospirillum arcachonense]